MRISFLGACAAIAGVIIIMGLSAWAGFELWAGRGDYLSAWITLGFELIALGGIAAAMTHAGENANKVKLAAVGVVLMAAVWCGFTMYEKLTDDARKRALTYAQSLPAWGLRENEAEAAGAAYQRALAILPDADDGPQTIRETSNYQETALVRLAVARDRAEARLTALVPVPRIDPILVFRGVAVEIAKLFGFVLFGVGLGWRRKDDTATQPADSVRVDGEVTTPPKLHAIGGGKADLPPPRQRRPL